MLNLNSVRAAISLHETVFLSADLEPIEPRKGQWFCEFDVDFAEEGNEILRDQALVEYIGQGEVYDEQCDEFRRPRGFVLILQS